MGAVALKLSRALFSEDVIARTAYRYTASHFVEIRADESEICIRLTPKNVGQIDKDLALRFRNDALDDRLRAAISVQTEDLKVALINAALISAQPLDRRGS